MSQKTKIKDYVFVGNYLTPKECDHCIKLYDTKKWVPHVWYNVESDTSKENNTDCNVANTDINFDDILIPAIRKALIDYVKKISKERIFSKITPIRLNRYGEGKDMKTHFDHIHSIFDGKDKGIPILSMVGLLNDNFTGGEFYVNGQNMKLKKGDIIIFPSNFLYPHEVRTIKKGERYSYVSWAF
tara:strand:- start:661 stop:1215 length:555 start_codon:yes stop_codon:yes gene_type:complete